jgi:riboflavin kinase/FMN adenylyltransferase
VKVTWLPDAEPRSRNVAVGEFDGVHLGHREVISGADTVLTFEPHPRAVVAPDSAPKLITPLEVKADIIAGLGVQELVVIPFDGAFAAQTADEFVDEILIRTLNAKEVSVGENFRFGNKAKGDVELLRSRPEFATRVADMVEVDGEIVSSTHIRGLIVAGEVDKASEFLGLPYHVRGIVQHGDKRGRTLGYPTANLVPDPALVHPGNGIYACRAAVQGDDGAWAWVPAAVSIGVRPTFASGRGILIEAYLIGFEGDLYGRELRLLFLRRLRGEKRFASAEELVQQMHQDVEEAARVAA